MRLKEKRNLYDWLLILLVFLTAFGGFGGALRPARIAAVLLLPSLLFKYDNCKYAKGVMMGLVAFYSYCLISILWTPDKEEGVVELVYYPIHFALFLEIIVFARYATNPLKNITTGWLFALAVCCVIAFWEITTGNHLEVAKEQKDVWNTGTEILNYLRSNATFYNSNGFVTFLCYGIPWLFYDSRSSNSLLRKIFGMVVIVSVIVISLLNGSRGGLLSFIIMLLIFVALSLRVRRKGFIAVLLLIPAAYFLYYLYTHSMFAIMLARVSDGGNFENESRFVIWGNALKAFGDTYGLGTGIGGMYEAMKVYSREGISITHNLFLEVLLQYGFVFAVTFVYFLWRQLKKSLRLENDRKMAMLMALLALPAYGIINSGYLLDCHLYVLMATIFVFANYERIKFTNRGVCAVA